GVKRLRPLAEKDRDNLPLQSDFALLLARAGEHAEAAERAGQLRRLAPRNPGYLYNAACAYSLCAAAVGPGGAVETPTAAALRERYAGLAVAALRDAAANGFADRELLRTDADLDPVRGHPGFAEVLRG